MRGTFVTNNIFRPPDKIIHEIVGTVVDDSVELDHVFLVPRKVIIKTQQLEFHKRSFNQSNKASIKTYYTRVHVNRKENDDAR